MMVSVFAYPTRLGCVFIKFSCYNWTYDLSGLFFDVVIKPSRFFSANDGVPATPVQPGGVSATLVQTYGIPDTSMKTDGAATTPVQSGGFYALTLTISIIGFSLWKSTFSSSVLQKIAGLPVPRTDLCPIQTTLRPIQTTPYVIPVWVW